ncbi:hypothetical protein ACN28S_61385 [Cystobacter fuscus]
MMKALATEPEARFQDATAFARALRSVREELSPGLGDSDLARLMGDAFAREKRVEDGVLGELLRGRSALRRPLTEKELPAFAPPTALAFEHRALDAPADFLPSSAVTLVEEPRRPLAHSPISREVRVAFDVDLTTHESEVARRDEGSGLVRAVVEDDEDEVLPAAPAAPSWTGWRAGALFLAALVLGFLLVWLLA